MGIKNPIQQARMIAICFFAIGLTCGAQKKESVYLYFDVNNINNKTIVSSDNAIRFYIDTNEPDLFFHNPKHHTVSIVSRSDIHTKLISKPSAKALYRKKVKQASRRSERAGKKSLPPLGIYYDDYFEKVYLYKPINSDIGYLYEVSWRHSPVE